ncbi:hypothetical protein V8F33_013574 [Rhypophila sp. PSN 637]
MPGQDPEGQFKFLLACIKHSVAGKINFEAVAHELGIVSKAAAAKRYERLLKAHGIGVGGATGGRAPRAPVPAPAPKGAKPTRKRKVAKREDDDDDDDDEEIPIKEEEEYGPAAKKSKIISALEGEGEDDEWDE